MTEPRESLEAESQRPCRAEALPKPYRWWKWPSESSDSDSDYNLSSTSRPKRSRFCHIFLVQSLVWKYCLKLEGCLHNFFLIGPYSAAAEPNSAPKIVTQFLEPSLVLLRRFCLNVRILRMSLNPRNHRCRYTLHSWSLVLCNAL